MKGLRRLERTVLRWHEQTEASHRTIENLLAHLEEKGVELPVERLLRELQEADIEPELPFNAEREQEAHRWLTVRMVMELLMRWELEFHFTPWMIDAVLKPRDINELSMHGYEFFLEWCTEHPWLVELLRRSVSGPLRLQVHPVYPADSDFIAWLFDPWNERVYRFSRTRGADTMGVVQRKGVVASSVGLHSSCILHRGGMEGRHPFVKIRRRIRAFKKNVAAEAVAAL